MGIATAILKTYHSLTLRIVPNQIYLSLPRIFVSCERNQGSDKLHAIIVFMHFKAKKENQSIIISG